jgi:protease IV
MDAPYQPQGSPHQPIQAVAVTPNAPAPPRKRSVLGRLFLVLLILAFFGSACLNLLFFAAAAIRAAGGESRVQEQHYSHERWAENKVAILSIEGVIVDGEGFFKRQLDHASQDAREGKLKALVVRVNSPGGTISGSEYMLHHLREFRRENPDVPVVVSMGALAASGGYYVSMAVGDTPDSIFAEPTTWTGSIGVIIPHFNFAGLMKEIGVEEDNVTSHHLKGMGSFARPMSEEEKKIFQGLVDDGFRRFKEVVQSGRPKFKADPAALDKLATGQIFTADQAKTSGLVDQLGFLEDAVERAIALAHLPKDNVTVVRYKNEPTLVEAMLGGQVKARPAIDWAALLDSTSPRGYYLCTWLPVLAGKPE